MLTLFYSKNSCSYAPHVLLYDVEANFNSIHVDINKGEQNTPEFLEMNIKGRVPVLKTSEGILTEVPAILLYIAQIYPQKKLIPLNPFSLAEAQAFNMFISSTIHVAHAHKHRGSRWTDDHEAQIKMTEKVTSNMAYYANIIEKKYLRGPYVLGDEYSICDPYLSLITRWLGFDGVSINEFPKIAKHNETMRLRPSVKKVLNLYD